MALSQSLRFEVLRRDAFTCQYCGAKAPDVKLQADHIVPRAAGGTDESSNLITACVACNIGKRDSISGQLPTKAVKPLPTTHLGRHTPKAVEERRLAQRERRLVEQERSVTARECAVEQAELDLVSARQEARELHYDRLRSLSLANGLSANCLIEVLDRHMKNCEGLYEALGGVLAGPDDEEEEDEQQEGAEDGG